MNINEKKNKPGNTGTQDTQQTLPKSWSITNDPEKVD